MSLAALIARYKHPPVTPVTPVTNPALPLQAAPTLTVTPVTPVTPQNTEGQSEKQNPDALLAEIAVMLQAHPNQLRALLCADDLDDIAQGYNSRADMLDYFRLMRVDGKLPTVTAQQPPAKAARQPQSHMEMAKAWKPAHELYLNHYTECSLCQVKQNRYCDEGKQLWREYWDVLQIATSPPAT